MHGIGLIVPTWWGSYLSCICYTCYVDEMNSLYMQCYLLLHYDDIGSVDLHVVLRCVWRLSGLWPWCDKWMSLVFELWIMFVPMWSMNFLICYVFINVYA